MTFQRSTWETPSDTIPQLKPTLGANPASADAKATLLLFPITGANGSGAPRGENYQDWLICPAFFRRKGRKALPGLPSKSGQVALPRHSLLGISFEVTPG